MTLPHTLLISDTSILRRHWRRFLARRVYMYVHYCRTTSTAVRGEQAGNEVARRVRVTR